MKKYMNMKMALLICTLTAGLFVNQAHAQYEFANPGTGGVSCSPSNFTGVGATGTLTVRVVNSGSNVCPAGSVDLFITLNQYVNYVSAINITGWTITGSGPDYISLNNAVDLPVFNGADLTFNVAAVQSTGGAQRDINAETALSLTAPGSMGDNINNNSARSSISVGNVILPVSLLSFNGVLQGVNALLTWETVTEVNSDHFEVQRSSDGRVFSKIGVQAAAGNSTGTRKYSMTDNLAGLTGTVYYRLLMVDKDGKLKISQVIALDLKGKKGILVTPTLLVRGQLATLRLDDATQIDQLRIITAAGRVVTLLTVKQQPTHIIETASLPGGTYLVEAVKNGNRVYSARFVVQ